MPLYNFFLIKHSFYYLYFSVNFDILWKRRLLTFLIIAFSRAIYTQTIFDKWYSKNDETSKVEDVIEAFEKDRKACTKLVEVKDLEKQNAVCNLCGVKINKKNLGLNILADLKKDGNKWSEGAILDPINGKIDTRYIKLINPNKLKVRGFIDFLFFGTTPCW